MERQNNANVAVLFGIENQIKIDVGLEYVSLKTNPRYRFAPNLSDDEYEKRFRAESMKELISYMIGCTLGRYSLEQPGLVYAGHRNDNFNPSLYGQFGTALHGVLPLTWGVFPDEAAKRFERFLKEVWPPESLEENIDFVAKCLGLKGGKNALEKVQSYLTRPGGYYRDHLIQYKRRPIYWKISSGKYRTFECLIYLHRFHSETLDMIRQSYVIPYISTLEQEYAKAASSIPDPKFPAEKTKLHGRLNELREFEQSLKVLSEDAFQLDLGDGVKKNYDFFGTLASDRKIVLGKR